MEHSQREILTSIQRRIDVEILNVEKALKNVRIFRRLLKKRRNFAVRRQFDVDISTVFYSASKKKRRKGVEKSTSKYLHRFDVEISAVSAGLLHYYGLSKPLERI